ncbi:hypothetical protein [Pandoraea pnomenusa]|uniref:hypothetical protein n=1 Tax=Pandoraea pnomenusa TaxID=93220 RepID=UPI0033417205
MNTLTKVLCYGGLLAVWGLFAWFGKTPVEGFIAAIGAALAALGVVHAGAVAKGQGTAPTAGTPQ